MFAKKQALKKEAAAKKRADPIEDDEEPELNDSVSEDDQDNGQNGGFIALEQEYNKSKVVNQKRQVKAAWEDEDDKDVEVDISKVSRLRKLRKNQEETKISGEEYQDRLKEYYTKSTTTSHFYDWVTKKTEDGEKQEESYLDSMLKSNVSIIEGVKTETIPADLIKISKAAEIPGESKHSCVIQALDFHRNNETLLSSGLDKTIKIFNLSKTFEANKYELRPMKTLHTKNLPILTAKFNCSQNEILASGMRKYLLSFDLVKETFDKSAPSFITSRLEGRIKSFNLSHDEETIALYGHNQYLMMASAKTKQLLYELRMNSEISACCFSPDNKYLFASTEDGDLYQWDLGMRKIVETFHDVGSQKTSCIDFSSDGSYLVSGNSVGIANLYGFNKLTRTVDKTLLKEIGNLTTSLDNVKINPASEVMAITSRWKRNAIRLVHLPSRTVYSNWPNFRTKLSFINRVEFSPNSKYMALGNELGNVFVYNFEHYE